MTFDALKLRVLFPRINFKIKYTAVIRGCRNMARAARGDRNLFGQCGDRIHRRHVMTGGAVHIGVARKFVSEGGGRIAFAPRQQHNFILDLHRLGDFRVEIRFRGRHG